MSDIALQQRYDPKYNGFYMRTDGCPNLAAGALFDFFKNPATCVASESAPCSQIVDGAKCLVPDPPPQDVYKDVLFDPKYAKYFVNTNACDTLKTNATTYYKKQDQCKTEQKDICDDVTRDAKCENAGGNYNPNGGLSNLQLGLILGGVVLLMIIITLVLLRKKPAAPPVVRPFPYF